MLTPYFLRTCTLAILHCAIIFYYRKHMKPHYDYQTSNFCPYFLAIYGSASTKTELSTYLQFNEKMHALQLLKMHLLEIFDLSTKTT